MNRPLDRFSRLITAKPYITLAVLLLVTIGLAVGASKRAPPVEGASLAFLPPGNPITIAVEELDESFGESSGVSVVTLVFRGEALTPGGLAQMDALIDSLLADPGVVSLLAPTDPLIAPSVLMEAFGGVDASSVTQAEIDALLGVPEIAGALALMSGADSDGTPVSVGSIRLLGTDEAMAQDAERSINEAAANSTGPLRVSSLSPVIIEDEYTEATETGMAPLIGIALLLIAGLILLFLRAFSDLVLTLTGLVFSLVWIVGAEGWLGPNALGWIGPPSSLSTMVPIIVISLTVDYAIQAISHYRELRAEGEEVLPAVRTGLSTVAVPLALAAVTTIASFLATLFSPIDVIGDFGIVAGLGVGLSLIVMLTIVPAGRALIDQRREARGKLKPPRPVSGALPGIERAARILGGSVARRPAPYLIAVFAVTGLFGIAATGLHSEFSIRDIIPRNGSVMKDMETLDAAVGGSTELASVLVKAEAAETRTILNVQDLSAALANPQRRPQAAAGPIDNSYVSVLTDWTHASGEPGDKYDAELASLFAEASAGVELDPDLMAEFLDKLYALDPSLSQLLVIDPTGPDSILLQFPVLTDNPGATAVLQSELEALWDGDDRGVTATASSVLSVTVTDQITSRQTEAITSTVGVALGILIIFFWLTLRRPTLGVIAVGPIVLILIWILGTMALLNIPYGLITSIITALSIGIGVDYTIHVIHRYREEFARVRNPERAVIRTLATTGSALLGSALTTALGFGVLFFSPLAGIQQFGLTAAIAIAYSLLVSILVVPPAMTVWGAYENMRLRSNVQRMWDDLDTAIEDIDQRHAKGT